MGLWQRVLCLSILSLVTISSSGASTESMASKPSIKKIKVNGIDTYLIDTAKGNAMALTVNVQVGSWHDDPIKHAGRAHLWEHTIFLGSKKHPLHHEFDELAPKVGGSHNAYTANDRTFYYFHQHPSSLALSTSLLGGMISEPIWNNEAFLKERDNVKNEALDYQNRDQDTIWDMPYIHLSPKGYPLAMYHVGTQDQLNAMTLDDLRSLYNSFYRPEYLQIIVAGNFDPKVPEIDRLDETKLVGLLQENFKLSSLNSEPTEKKKDLPPLYPTDADAPRMMEIGSSSEQKILSLRFQATDFAHANPFLAETVIDSLNLDTSGSLTRLLQDRGLITKGGFGVSRLNNQSQVAASFTLTEEGAKNRDLVMKLIFNALSDLSKNGLDEETFVYLQKRNISSYQEFIQQPNDAAEYFARFLELPYPTDKAFDFQFQFGNLKASDVPQMATSLFSPDRMIGAYMGNDVVGTEKCPIFGRSFKKVSVANSLQIWRAAFQNKIRELKPNENKILLKKIPLTFSETPQNAESREATEIKSSVTQTKMVLEEDHSTTDSAIRLILQLPPAEIEEAIARELLILAFQERFEGELGYLSSLNLMRGYSADAYELEIAVKGNSSANRQAMHWIFDRLIEFKPTPEETTRARTLLVSRWVKSLDDFTARTASRAANATLSKVGALTQEKIAIAKEITHAKVLSWSRKIFNRADILVAASGDVTPIQLNDVAFHFRRFIPYTLSDSEREGHKEKSVAIKNHVLLWAPLGDSKAEDAFAHTRVYEGPEIDSDEALLFPTFSLAFGNAVYKLNRSERMLGYIHNAHASISNSNFRISLVGQTDGAEKFPKIEAGWKELIAQVKDGTFSRQQLLDTIEGQRLTLLLKPSTLSAEVDELLHYFHTYRDLNRRERQLAALQTAKPADLLAIGAKFLNTKKFLEVIGSKSRPCKEALKSLVNARRKLKQ